MMFCLFICVYIYMGIVKNNFFLFIRVYIYMIFSFLCIYIHENSNL